MDTLPLTPSRRLYAQQTYGRAADAFETVAWRPPSPRRFEEHVANDVPRRAHAFEPTLKELTAEIPGWVTVVAGGVVAALMGALMGGALSL